MVHEHRSAFIGFLLAVPFFILNFIVALHLEPAYSFLGAFPAVRTSTFTPLVLLLLFPVGAYIALRPVLQKPMKKKKRTILLTNIIVGGALLMMFFLLFGALGAEFYRCEIAGIPDCD